MTDVRTQQVIDVLTDMGFKRQQANASHALYTHKAGASVSIPHQNEKMSPSHVTAIERQVAGFGIAKPEVFKQKLLTPRRGKFNDRRFAIGGHNITMSDERPVGKIHRTKNHRPSMGGSMKIMYHDTILKGESVITYNMADLKPRPVHHSKKTK